ncbi:MAG: hypothetical protein K0S76_1672 [Herbinix sp.]|nr:hypothetical protein [Herbinix sp.]
MFGKRREAAEEQGDNKLKGQNSNKRKKNRIGWMKIIAGFVLILWGISTFTFLQAIRKPVVTEEKVVQNVIEQKESFSYSVKVKPSLLYLDGGTISPDDVVFNNLTDHLILDFDLSVNSRKPVKVQGNVSLVYKLVAESMWEREFTLRSDKSIDSVGVSNSIMQEQVTVNINDILQYLKQIEEETSVRPSGYTLTFKPIFNGVVYDEKGNKLDDLTSNLEILFDLNSQYLKYSSENASDELVTTKSIEERRTIPQEISFLNWNISVMKSRVIFGLLSLLSLIPIVIMIIRKMRTQKNQEAEDVLIDKRHRSKIIEVSDKISLDLMPHLGLKNFNVLLQIAEEKDEPILKYSSLDTVSYYVMGTSSIYHYDIQIKCG